MTKYIAKFTDPKTLHESGTEIFPNRRALELAVDVTTAQLADMMEGHSVDVQTFLGVASIREIRS